MSQMEDLGTERKVLQGGGRGNRGSRGGRSPGGWSAAQRDQEPALGLDLGRGGGG